MKKTKRLLSSFLAVFILLTMLPTVAAAGPDGNYADLLAAYNATQAGGQLTLDRNYVIDQTLYIDKQIRIEGHGFSISADPAFSSIGDAGAKYLITISADNVELRDLGLDTGEHTPDNAAFDPVTGTFSGDDWTNNLMGCVNVCQSTGVAFTNCAFIGSYYSIMVDDSKLTVNACSIAETKHGVQVSSSSVSDASELNIVDLGLTCDLGILTNVPIQLAGAEASAGVVAFDEATAALWYRASDYYYGYGPSPSTIQNVGVSIGGVITKFADIYAAFAAAEQAAKTSSAVTVLLYNQSYTLTKALASNYGFSVTGIGNGTDPVELLADEDFQTGYSDNLDAFNYILSFAGVPAGPGVTAFRVTNPIVINNVFFNSNVDGTQSDWGWPDAGVGIKGGLNFVVADDVTVRNCSFNGGVYAIYNQSSRVTLDGVTLGVIRDGINVAPEYTNAIVSVVGAGVVDNSVKQDTPINSEAGAGGTAIVIFDEENVGDWLFDNGTVKAGAWIPRSAAAEGDLTNSVILKTSATDFQILKDISAALQAYRPGNSILDISTSPIAPYFPGTAVIRGKSDVAVGLSSDYRLIFPGATASQVAHMADYPPVWTVQGPATFDSANGIITVTGAGQITITVTLTISADISMVATFDINVPEPFIPVIDVDEPPLSGKTFIDDDGNWAELYIESLARQGYVGGKVGGIFAPGDALTRAECAMILFNAFGTEGSPASGFTDVPAGAWFENAINWAAAQGLFKGYGNGMVCPNNAITRQELAVVVVNLCEAFDIKLPDTIAKADFADEADIAVWAVEAVHILQPSGIISGKPGNLFDPEGDTLREQAAKVFYFVLDYAGKIGKDYKVPTF